MRQECRRLIQAYEGVVDSKSLTGPLIISGQTVLVPNSVKLGARGSVLHPN
jgi:hypothetical protein